MIDVADTQELSLTKKGKPRKRKPKQKNVYFTEDTENAILNYNRPSITFEEKNKIYNEKIHYAFYKLAENIIHTFKFYYTDVENIEDLKYEVIAFLLQKIHLYDQSKGKAYSYFGTIAKRYLIIYTQKNYKRLVNRTNIEDIGEDFEVNNGLFERIDEKQVDAIEVLDEFLKVVEDRLLDEFPKKEDFNIAVAVLEIFKKRDKLDIFNKKALFIYIKEMTDAQSNAITKVIKKLKIIYKEVLMHRLENIDN
jgi:hypothetical protein